MARRRALIRYEKTRACDEAIYTREGAAKTKSEILEQKDRSGSGRAGDGGGRGGGGRRTLSIQGVDCSLKGTADPNGARTAFGGIHEDAQWATCVRREIPIPMPRLRRISRIARPISGGHDAGEREVGREPRHRY